MNVSVCQDSLHLNVNTWYTTASFSASAALENFLESDVKIDLVGKSNECRSSG